MGVKQSYIPEELREIVKIIIGITVYIHKLDGSFESPEVLGYDNFRTFQGVVSLKGATFKYKSLSSIKNDFKMVVDFIRNCIFAGYPSLPSDFKHLLDQMADFDENNWTCKLDQYFLYHPAVMTHCERIQFLVNSVEKQHGLCSDFKSKVKYQRAVQALDNKVNWTDLFSRPTKKIFGPLVACYDDRPESYYDKFDDDGNCYWANSSLLQCARNMATHIAKKIADSSTKKFGNKEIDVMVTSLFEDALLEFYSTLHDQGILNEIVNWMEKLRLGWVEYV